MDHSRLQAGLRLEEGLQGGGGEDWVGRLAALHLVEVDGADLLPGVRPEVPVLKITCRSAELVLCVAAIVEVMIATVTRASILQA